MIMDKVILGDNQFFAVNHLSDERSRQQAVRFKEDKAIIDVLDTAIDCGVNTFMCTTHDRIANICEHMRQSPEKYADFKFYPCMPYAHKYANAVTELGILGTLKAYLPGNLLSVVSKSGIAYARKDFPALMELLVDAEMKMFRGLNTPVIFLQNVMTDLLYGLGMKDILVHFAEYIRKKYNAEPGFITMNLPQMVDFCEENDFGEENSDLVYPFMAGTCFMFDSPLRFYEYAISIDYGTVNPCSAGIWGHNKKHWYRISEYYFDSRKEGYQRTDEEHFGEICRLIGDKRIKAFVIDPSAASFIELVRRDGRLPVVVAVDNIGKGISQVESAIKSGEIRICRCCRNAIREFNEYKIDSLTHKPIRENDHAMDDIRYFVSVMEKLK